MPVPHFEIWAVCRRDTGFGVVVFDDPRPGHLRRDDPDAFTLAVVASPLDAEASALAFACDFLAVGPDVSLVAVTPAMLRRRAGAAVEGAIGADGRIGGARLHALGLAAVLIDADVETVRRRTLGQAGTLLALKQARPLSCPQWFDEA